MALRSLQWAPQGASILTRRWPTHSTATPLAQGLALERNLFLKLCTSEAGLARMRSYEAKKITSPSRGFEI
jgi:hypothetical protein